MLKYEGEAMLGLIAHKSRHSSGVDVLRVFCWCFGFCVVVVAVWGFFPVRGKEKVLLEGIHVMASVTILSLPQLR